MAFDDACHVRHVAVAEFDVKFVANFVEAVVWGEVLVGEIEELFANICFDFHVVWRIEPGDVSLSVFCFLRFGGVVGCMGYAVQGKCPAFLKASA